MTWENVWKKARKKTTEYPLAFEDEFPLIENEDVLVRDDIFKILEESGVGIPHAVCSKIDQPNVKNETQGGG